MSPVVVQKWGEGAVQSYRVQGQPLVVQYFNIISSKVASISEKYLVHYAFSSSVVMMFIVAYNIPPPRAKKITQVILENIMNYRLTYNTYQNKANHRPLGCSANSKESKQQT